MRLRNAIGLLCATLALALSVPSGATAATCTEGQPKPVRAGGTLTLGDAGCKGFAFGTARLEIVDPPRRGTAAIRLVESIWTPGYPTPYVEYVAPREAPAETLDPFTYRAVSTTTGEATAPATLRPVIKAATFNRAPECSGFLGLQTEIEADEAAHVTMGCWDPDGDPVGPSTGSARHGTLTATGSGMRYVPAPGFDPGPDGTTDQLVITAADEPPPPAQPLAAAPTRLDLRIVRPDHNPVCHSQEHRVFAGTGFLPVELVCTDDDPADVLRVSASALLLDQQETERGRMTGRIAIPDSGDHRLRIPFWVRDGAMGVNPMSGETIFFADDGGIEPGVVTVEVVDAAAATRRMAATYLAERVAPAVRRAVRRAARGRRARVGPFAIDVVVKVRGRRAVTVRAGDRRRVRAPRGRRVRVAIRHADTGARSTLTVRTG